MLRTIKTVHTIIWAVMVAAIFHIIYAGIYGIYDLWLAVAVALLTGETIVLVLNKWTCPLTPMARKYSKDTSDNFDIYLPSWLAKHNKEIFGTLFAVGLLILLVRLGTYLIFA